MTKPGIMAVQCSFRHCSLARCNTVQFIIALCRSHVVYCMVVTNSGLHCIALFGSAVQSVHCTVWQCSAVFSLELSAAECSADIWNFSQIKSAKFRGHQTPLYLVINSYWQTSLPLFLGVRQHFAISPFDHCHNLWAAPPGQWRLAHYQTLPEALGSWCNVSAAPALIWSGTPTPAPSPAPSPAPAPTPSPSPVHILNFNSTQLDKNWRPIL